MPQPDRIRAALAPLCVEHLQELRDFGVPPTVRQALDLTMWVVTGDPGASWRDALAIWTTGGFSGGLRVFIALLQDFEPGADRAWEDTVYEFVTGEAAAALKPEQPVGVALVDFLTAVFEHSGTPSD